MEKSQYDKIATFAGPKDAVLSVSFSAFGEYVSAAGELLQCATRGAFLNISFIAGYDGIFCWDVATGEPVLFPNLAGEEEKTEYFACTWIYFAKTSQHVLILGDVDGKISAWDLEPGSGDMKPVS